MEEIAATIEDDLRHAGRCRPLGDQFADQLRGFDVGTGLQRFPQILVDDDAAARVLPSLSSITWT